MPREIPKAYEPQEIEERWAKAWFEEQLFRAENSGPGGPIAPGENAFSIALPPPNVTGYIHIGHMLEHTQIDALTRWHRMRGERTLWLPGMDHAGISTQVVVERELAKQNLSRQSLGREEFERRVWEWKAQSGGTIKKQMIRLGASCDWSRERFTLDPPLYRAVLEAFLRLFHEGLIYRGRYMVNWCPRCMTALSDLETVHQERQGQLWYIRYPVIGSAEHVVVATTRPETMLGDTGVAVHPEDERYKHLVGRKIRLPLMNREIPVIADSFVDREFGTGAVKITPAHDPNDFEAGKRHNLPEIDVMTDDGHMSAAAGAYAGLDRFAARKRVVEDLKAQGLLEKVTEHIHAIALCERCHTIVEPRASTQWFCKMKPLAEPAIAAVERGEIRIMPENWREVYFQWMRNIRDWTLSRQLWWGHRIPAWHCGNCKEITVAREAPAKCPKCGSTILEQDPDVLDTWFSSGLWPFATLGWPENTPDFQRYYPTSLLITGYEILFFWVARMAMMGIHFTGKVPFRDVYLHSIVRTVDGQKMSKSKGTGIDPIDVNRRYGTDAMRFTLATMAAPGSDLIWTEDRIQSSRNFANKIWNAARFLFVNLDKFEQSGISLDQLASPGIRAKAPYAVNGGIPLIDGWLFARLASTIDLVNEALKNYRFHEAAQGVYQFFWGDFCDWYIEWVKPELLSADKKRAVAAWRNLFSAFDAALRLLHPFMPFLTEELWHQLPQRPGAKSIALDSYPEARTDWKNSAAQEQFSLIKEVVQACRNIRAEMKLDPKKKVAAEFSSSDAAACSVMEANRDGILRLAVLSELKVGAERLAHAGGAVRSTSVFDLHIAYAAETVDLAAETARLRKEIEGLEKAITAKERQLGDATFRSRAPEKIVRGLETTLAGQKIELQKLQLRLEELKRAA